MSDVRRWPWMDHAGEIADGEFSAVYFNRTKWILDEENPDLEVTMQVFQRDIGTVLAGVDEAVAMIMNCSDYGGDRLTIDYLPDGTVVEPREPVMHISGPLADFVHLESVYLGILASGSSVATAVRECVEAAGGRDVFYLADRFNRYTNQESQGYAAHIGGAAAVCTARGAALFGGEAVGTMPHALIAAYGGDVVQASLAFNRHFPEVNLVALVDFNNDCVTDALAVATALGDRLYAVRLDTSGNLTDESIAKGVNHPYGHTFQFGKHVGLRMTGVSAKLVDNVRSALDAYGFNHVKIAASGGFDPVRIRNFVDLDVPVDIFGVGSYALSKEIAFTADVVIPTAKVGRGIKPLVKAKTIRVGRQRS